MLLCERRDEERVGILHGDLTELQNGVRCAVQYDLDSVEDGYIESVERTYGVGTGVGAASADVCKLVLHGVSFKSEGIGATLMLSIDFSIFCFRSSVSSSSCSPPRSI